MTPRALQVLAALGGTGAVLAAGLLVAFRVRFAPVLDRIRRFNRGFTNPRLLAADAGQPGASASVVHHHGRRTGREYRTPIAVQPADAGTYLVALPYGSGTDWARNVLAAGSALLEHEGMTIRVDRPRVVAAAEVRDSFRPAEQRIQRWFGVSDVLLLHDADTA